jgi:hypothetical protein
MIFSTLENGKIKKVDKANPIFERRCDVLVVGAGSAGVYAAASAARMGADVILAEIEENIGGMSVCGNVTAYYYGMSGGSFEEDDKKSNEDKVFLTNRWHWEQRQIRFFERLLKSGVEILCRYIPIGLFFDGKRVVGVSFFDGKKRVNIKADVTVDATSDGHLIRMTDVKKEFGRDSDGSFVPFTVRTQYTKNGRLSSCNSDSGIMNHYDKGDFSKKIIIAHANAKELMKEGEIVSVALTAGVREGLTFEGEERLQYDDLLFGKTPEKVLFWAYSDLDRHGSERATEKELFQNWWVISNLATVTITIPVPLGSVVPKGIRGLVTAGRCFSCDTYTQSAVRMNRDMFRMGECVGVAAALAARSGVDFLEIDYNRFLAEVNRLNCYDGGVPRGFYFDNSYAAYIQKMKTLGRAPDEKYSHLLPNDFIRERAVFDVSKSFPLLKTDSPGVAIWSAFLSNERKSTCEKIYTELINTEDTLYKYNCAITLGLLEDTRALPTLREIINGRDCFFFKDNRRSNQFRSVICVCLLGRIGEAADKDLLLALLEEKEFENPMYHTLKANYLYHTDPDRKFVYFAVITHACMALYHLYKRHGMPFRELNSKFKEFFQSPQNIKNITESGFGTPAYEELFSFIEYIIKITE